jgi:hypothetical protein
VKVSSVQLYASAIGDGGEGYESDNVPHASWAVCAVTMSRQAPEGSSARSDLRSAFSAPSSTRRYLALRKRVQSMDLHSARVDVPKAAASGRPGVHSQSRGSLHPRAATYAPRSPATATRRLLHAAAAQPQHSRVQARALA